MTVWSGRKPKLTVITQHSYKPQMYQVSHTSTGWFPIYNISMWTPASERGEVWANRNESYSCSPCRSKVYSECNFSQREIYKQWLMQYSLFTLFQIGTRLTTIVKQLGVVATISPERDCTQFRKALLQILCWFHIYTSATEKYPQHTQWFAKTINITVLTIKKNLGQQRHYMVKPTV